MTIHLILDGQKVDIEEGQSVLDVINESGKLTLDMSGVLLAIAFP